VLSWYGLLYLEARPARWRVYLQVLLEGYPGAEARSILRRLGPPARTAELLGRDLQHLRTLLRQLFRARELPPSRVYRWLAEAPVDVILGVMARAERPELRRAIGDFLTAKRRTRPLLRGNDLKAIGLRPGPIYRDILASLLYARLDGLVESRDDELRFVRRRFARALAEEARSRPALPDAGIDKRGAIG
jgi:tRNA nucleotidyltransferase (CCA-adding enzyme)